MKKIVWLIFLIFCYLSAFSQKEYDPVRDGDSVAMNLFRQASKVATVDSTDTHNSTGLSQYSFNPRDKKYEYIKNPTTSTTQMEYWNARNQPFLHKIARYFSNNLLLIIGYVLAAGLAIVLFNRMNKKN